MTESGHTDEILVGEGGRGGGERRGGEEGGQISWTYLQNVVRTNEIAGSRGCVAQCLLIAI